MRKGKELTTEQGEVTVLRRYPQRGSMETAKRSLPVGNACKREQEDNGKRYIATMVTNNPKANKCEDKETT